MLVRGHRTQDIAKGSYGQARVIRYGKPLMSWRFRLKDYVTAYLVRSSVIPTAAQSLG